MGVLIRGQWLKSAACSARILALVAGIILCGPVAFAQDSSLQIEKKVKAGLIYNFLKYTDWPDDAALGNRTIRLCLLGGNPFDGALNPLEGRTAQNRPIDIANIDHIEDGKSCHLLFIHRNLRKSLPDYLTQMDAHPVLLISDMQDFTKMGGMVEFATEDGYINIHVNKDALKKSRVVIQDRLLKLSKNY